MGKVQYYASSINTGSIILACGSGAYRKHELCDSLQYADGGRDGGGAALDAAILAVAMLLLVQAALLGGWGLTATSAASTPAFGFSGVFGDRMVLQRASPKSPAAQAAVYGGGAAPGAAVRVALSPAGGESHRSGSTALPLPLWVCADCGPASPQLIRCARVVRDLRDGCGCGR